MLSDFYEPNRTFRYYAPTLDWIRQLRPTSVLDVGGRRSPILDSLSPDVERVCLDIERIPGLKPGIRRITADFSTWVPDKRYDVVVCLQVLQNIQDAAAFARKLLSVGTHVILCVPYKLPFGMNTGPHSMIDESTLFKWTGRVPAAVQLIREPGLSRILSLYPELTNPD
jgi:hypothetical protein